MKRGLSLAALALPVLGLTISAGWHQWRQSGATEWRIPVTGYDPRDLLAGHYARFRYAWRLEGQCPSGDCMFCLEDRRGEVVARIEPKARSEEHTSELQSLMRISYAVFCLKKKNTKRTNKERVTTKQTEMQRNEK